MIIPEIILYNTIKAAIKLVGDDWRSEIPTKNDSILYKMFHSDDNANLIKLETFDYYTQATNLFTRRAESQRQISINIGYNMERKNSPTIHILLPRETKGRIDSLGNSEDNVTSNIGTQVQRYTKETSHSATFILMITSDNTMEVLLIYYFLKSILTYLTDHLELNGLMNSEYEWGGCAASSGYCSCKCIS
jgi:hypothetical protein